MKPGKKLISAISTFLLAIVLFIGGFFFSDETPDDIGYTDNYYEQTTSQDDFYEQPDDLQTYEQASQSDLFSDITSSDDTVSADDLDIIPTPADNFVTENTASVPDNENSTASSADKPDVSEIDTTTESAASTVSDAKPDTSPSDAISEDGSYTSKEEVALYLHTYKKLPSNYITKRDAQDMGWDSSKGNLWKVAPGKSIGGDKFGNYEGLLPKKKNRQYYECDIDYDGGYRNAQRIIFSNDGLIYYTEDHYQTFELLYDGD